MQGISSLCLHDTSLISGRIHSSIVAPVLPNQDLKMLNAAGGNAAGSIAGASQQLHTRQGCIWLGWVVVLCHTKAGCLLLLQDSALTCLFVCSETKKKNPINSDEFGHKHFHSWHQKAFLHKLLFIHFSFWEYSTLKKRFFKKKSVIAIWYSEPVLVVTPI